MDKFVIRKNKKPEVSCLVINNNNNNNANRTTTTTTTTTYSTTTTTTITTNSDNNNIKSDTNISKEELLEILRDREKYLKHQKSAKKAYAKYAATEKGKEARRKAMKNFRKREKEKDKITVIKL